MVNIRRADERGRTNWAWLDSRHSFSFGEYHDPAQMGFRTLRVINDDRVLPGAGFGAHRHQDMEILSYVLEGALEHRDSLGNGSVIQPGDRSGGPLSADSQHVRAPDNEGIFTHPKNMRGKLIDDRWAGVVRRQQVATRHINIVIEA